MKKKIKVKSYHERARRELARVDACYRSLRDLTRDELLILQGAEAALRSVLDGRPGPAALRLAREDAAHAELMKAARLAEELLEGERREARAALRLVAAVPVARPEPERKPPKPAPARDWKAERLARLRVTGEMAGMGRR